MSFDQAKYTIEQLVKTTLIRPPLRMQAKELKRDLGDKVEYLALLDPPTPLHRKVELHSREFESVMHFVRDQGEFSLLADNYLLAIPVDSRSFFTALGGPSWTPFCKACPDTSRERFRSAVEGICASRSIGHQQLL